MDAVKQHDANFVALSALLTTTMVNMKAIIEALVAAGLRDKVKVLVGGAPLTDAWAHSIGADGYGKDAPGAVELARKLLPASLTHALECGPALRARFCVASLLGPTP